MTLRDWFDAPRFCPDDGEPIRVTNENGFDPRTGKPRDRWVWRCPHVFVSWEGGDIEWRQQGSAFVHAHGTGRPRWHRRGEQP